MLDLDYISPAPAMCKFTEFYEKGDSNEVLVF